MKLKFIELIRSAFGKRDQKFRQRMTIFLICLVISIFVWFTIKMDDEYQELVTVSLKFINPPRTKVLLEVSDSALQVELRDKGSELLKYRYVVQREALLVNMRNIVLTTIGRKSNGYLLTSTLANDLGYQLGVSGSVIAVSPDTIFFTFIRESSRKLPVTAEFQLETQKQYMVYGNVIIEPDSLLVKGPEDILAGMSSLSLGTIILNGLAENTSFTRKVNFDSGMKYLTAIPNEVSVTIPVEKFTESAIQVPIKVIADSGAHLKLFPEYVTVSYLVALKDYSQVTPGMFQMVADFRGLDLEDERKIRVKAEEIPATIKITRIEPERVEFIILN